MSYDIYICGDCGGPYWFPLGQKTHLGTGWYCWKKKQGDGGGGGGGGSADQVVEFVFSTPPEDLKRLTDEAVSLYDAWRRDDADRRVVKFLSGQLAKGKSDVVHQFLAYLLGEDKDRRRRFVDILVATSAWDKFTG